VSFAVKLKKSFAQNFRTVRSFINTSGWNVLPLLYAVLACVVLASISQPILSGDVTSNRYWLSAAFQGIATIFALLTSAFLIIGQLAAQLYPQRVLARIYRSPIVLAHAIGGILLLMLLLIPQTGLRDGAQYPVWVLRVDLVLALMYLGGVPAVINVAVSMVRPVKVLNSNLERIDSKLLSELNTRYGEHNFAPRYIEEDQILEFETIVAAFFKQGESQYAGVAIRGLFKRLEEVAEPDDYEAIAHHFGSVIRQLGRMIIEVRREDLMHQLCAGISNLHEKLYDANYSSTPEYERVSLPKVLLGLLEDCVECDFKEGAVWAIVALKWAEPADRKQLAKDTDNGHFKDIIRIQSGGKLSERSKTEWAENFRYMGYSALYIREVEKIVQEKARKNYGGYLSELIRHYYHLTYSILELNSESHALTKKDLLNNIVFNLKGVVVSAASNGDLNPFELSTLTTMVDALLRGKEYGSAVSLFKLICDALLRMVDQIRSCSQLLMPIIEITVNGLNSIDNAPDGADIAKIAGQTLIKLSEALPKHYASEGLGEEYKSLSDELGSRIKQLLEGKLDTVDPALAEELKVALRKYWSEKYSDI